MSDADQHRNQRDALQEIQEHATRYGEAVNRYMGAVGYLPAEPAPLAVKKRHRTAGLVLVGVDETPTSYIAVDHAAIEAELHGWDLRLLHVRPLAGLSDAHETPERLLKRLTDRVHGFSPGVAVSGRVDVGNKASVLLADACDADLVVVGHRHRAAGTAFGLSVADRVAARHTGPVFVVRMPGWPPSSGFGARPIVVGADGASETTAAVKFALIESRVRGCDVVMLHAGHGERPVPDQADIRDGVTVHHREVVGDPVSALIEASGTAAAVVVGRRGPGGFTDAMLGSVSRSLVQHAWCPVFLVG